MKSALVIACACVALNSLAAQDKPNFAGRWSMVLDSAAGRGGGRGGGRGAQRGDMGSGWGSNITITQNASRLTVEYAFFTRGDMQPPLRFNYPLDGTATTNTVMMGRGMQTQTSTSAWDGARLVITTKFPFTNPADGTVMTSEVTHTLSLDSPTQMVVETHRAAVLGGPALTTTTTYRKN